MHWPHVRATQRMGTTNIPNPALKLQSRLLLGQLFRSQSWFVPARGGSAACSSRGSACPAAPGGWRESEGWSHLSGPSPSLSGESQTWSPQDKSGLEGEKNQRGPSISLRIWSYLRIARSPDSLPAGQTKVTPDRKEEYWAAYTPATLPPIDDPSKWKGLLSRPMLCTNCTEGTTAQTSLVFYHIL